MIKQFILLQTILLFNTKPKLETQVTECPNQCPKMLFKNKI